MSLESYTDDPTYRGALTVQIPLSEPSSSLESSQTSSPTGILDSSTTTSASCSSLPIQTLNVKFAPLPQLAPRKRRSTAPLGMAARSQLVRRRRGYYEPDVSPRYGSDTSTWTEQELSEAQMRQVAAAMQQEAGRQKEEAQDPDDPFLIFGRMVKGASKQIWRRVSNKEKKETSDKEGKPRQLASSDSNDEQDQEKETPTGSDTPELAKGSKPSTPVDGVPLRPILVPSSTPTHVEEAGGVWEEEVGRDFPLNVGQTETIIEGRVKYVMPDEQVNDTPKTKTLFFDQATTPSTPTPTSGSPPGRVPTNS